LIRPTTRGSASSSPRSALVSAPRLVLATGRYIGEGFDDARLDTLFLTMPVSWKGTLVQYTGRLHRLHPGKTEVRIYDYVDREVPLFVRMFAKRLRGYRAIGYTPDTGPLNDDVGSGDSTGDGGTTETPAIPISRKTRRPRSGRRPRKAPPRIPAPW
jgi:superfamily II DNA or RNA helicase